MERQWMNVAEHKHPDMQNNYDYVLSYEVHKIINIF